MCIIVFKEIKNFDSVLKFSGHAYINKVDAMTNDLLNNLKKLNIKVIGNPFLMRYNSPFTPDFLRRNEIAVEILGIV